MKTHKTAAKRFKITGRGKLLRYPGATSHLRAKESAFTHKRKEQIRRVGKRNTKRVKRLIGL